MFRELLSAIDDTASASAALSFATALARAEGATVHVVHRHPRADHPALHPSGAHPRLPSLSLGGAVGAGGGASASAWAKDARTTVVS